jgi:hypothetical protein
MGTSPEAPFFVHRGGATGAEKVCHGGKENNWKYYNKNRKLVKIPCLLGISSKTQEAPLEL